MPTPIHNLISTFLADEITEQLRGIVEKGGHAGEFAARIVNVGSSRIVLMELRYPLVRNGETRC